MKRFIILLFLLLNLVGCKQGHVTTFGNGQDLKKEVTDYILSGQADKSEAEKLKWRDVFLMDLDIDKLYEEYLAQEGTPDDVEGFATYLTHHAPINEKWQELTRASVHEHYGYTITTFRSIGGVLYQGFVEIDGKEVPYIVVNARTGYYHG